MHRVHAPTPVAGIMTRRFVQPKHLLLMAGIGTVLSFASSMLHKRTQFPHAHRAEHIAL